MTKPTTIPILLIISLLFSPTCFALTRYVNTASTVGGNGTTNATTGDNRAYASLSEWEDAEDNNTLTEPMIVYCEGSAADTTAVTIADWTGNSAANYIKITTTQANRHDGKWDEGKYRLDFSDDYAYPIRASNNYVRIEGLQMHNSNALGYGFRYDGTGELYFSHNILRGGTYANVRNSVFLYYMGASTVKIWNNILYDLYRGIFFEWNIAGSTFIIYNNTIVDINGDGIEIRDAVDDCTLYLKNNLVFNAAIDYDVSNFTAQDYDYNMGEDAAFTGDSHYVQTSQAGTTIFADYANDDFRLSSSNDAKDAGTFDPGSGLFTDDIDGQSRPGIGSAIWDIGADEYSSGTTIRGATIYEAIIR